MGIPNQQKVHKRLSWYDKRLTAIERREVENYVYYRWVWCVCLLIALFADAIRHRPFELDWLQSLGIIGAVYMIVKTTLAIRSVYKAERGVWK